ncbi:MAG: MaoC family dehydratase N-terminal domain-containing protein [Candidatus Dormibacteraeota bacterium]|nr:MaoC family dehydratase N-terminal domain-containing protein [Candidatus Dormibacteraeota bacterium]
MTQAADSSAWNWDWHVTREQITAYAAASGDRNPIHLDDEFARSVGLPGVIAHGMLGMAQLANFVVQWAGDHRRLRLLRCRFAGIVRPGDVISFSGQASEVRDGLVQLELSAKNQRGERILTRARAEVTA